MSQLIFEVRLYAMKVVADLINNSTETTSARYKLINEALDLLDSDPNPESNRPLMLKVAFLYQEALDL